MLTFPFKRYLLGGAYIGLDAPSNSASMKVEQRQAAVESSSNKNQNYFSIVFAQVKN